MTLLSSAPGTASRAALTRYNNDAVLNATPVQLLTMLYDRLLLDLRRSEAAQLGADWPKASENLLHAQAIVTELSVTLKTDVWEGAEGLMALYTYISTTLINANVHREVEHTRECITLLEPLRAAWHEAAGALPAHEEPLAHTTEGLGIG